MNWDERRVKIIEELRKLGIEPYPAKYEITHTIKDIKNLALSYDSKSHEPFVFNISTAGRVANIRRHGKASFVDIFDEGEKLQLYLRVNELNEKYEDFFKYIDRGDIIGVKGDVFYTMKGELSLLVKDYKLLSKALVEPPDWSKLSPEFRYAHRYVDFLYNDNARRAMEIRYSAIRSIREYLYSKGFIEVETPVVQPVYGGALARPFRTHVNYLNEDWYLRIALELYLKRYIIGGFNKVFEIGKVFRNEDIDVTHNPEFTLLELYWAYADYNDIMNLTEDLIRTVAKRVLNTTKITYSKYEIDLEKPFRRVSMFEALSEALGKNVEGMTDEELTELMKKYGLIPRGNKYIRGLMIEKLFDKLVVPNIVDPTFITDYPIETTPLCKPHRSKQGLVERFELFIAGMEFANAYTELNDPILQDKLFKEEQEMFKRGDEEAHPYDKDFIRALSYGMPPTGGLGIGIDRLIMLLTNNYSIKEVIPFPMISSKVILEDD
ncbi:lysine--tRNA ligase [Sulfolobus sp. A20]|uniref:lysine--tRNA ligase n=1 Tax=Saccharolobus sp. A20 TaxID=1891280 RepID=UPI000845BEFE|nr:lysine--tRNA ligase [Sulfolobus sp. A20]TRM75036.1 lysine--tRNA ligase [Sulfolobus sp. A20-N-F8]TRM78630.1 lysine--tRNA ligase [Sulfolobus sp. B5]TRM84614.1 lysine--tRNA ligase [Sulfolobus sp. F3]TRN01450.1 lysine--tRNA ligase [Sulfolobus sp. E1]AOL16236.1 lysine--tRNA ligase [Sulfolobus sp. A20]